MAKSKKRNTMWLTTESKKRNWCGTPEAYATCGNKDCEGYEETSEFDISHFEEAVYGGVFICKRCGHKEEYLLYDGDREPLPCRCFSAIIAKKEIRFCMFIRLCGACLTPHYARPCIVAGKDDHCCEQTKNWRIYISHTFDCCHGHFPMPDPTTCVIVPMKKGT